MPATSGDLPAWRKCKFLEFDGPAGNFCWHPNRVNACLEAKCPMPPVTLIITINDEASE